ncbi:sensor histidine kinase VncS [Streptococcus oralis]|uniref:histidine kinase n=1 Tax=Streptococcus oralis subsp. tigurinus TaxID=1077464 RepID=A0AAX0N3B1_STROR|nr:sensor histidine kinase VncS [Streptococcus oralis]MBS3687768.1 sensor histidine kinase VncS [Streptococcus oralis]MCY7083026.1 sensor histidine kinase VncS [Streptococcus oralis]MCY7106458.1 sensor histidine kinase VncS [Streptococcus oralis]ORO32459.1 sensor histidine kinase [Streptococcus oralis subsp. tigurinus]
MKRTGLFTKIFIYTFSIFSVLVICLHLAIYFLFPSTYLSHRQETIGQKATAIAQSLDGKDRQSIEQVLDLYSQTSDIKGSVKGEMTEDKLEVKDNFPLDTARQTTSLFIEEREVKTQDGSTMTLQFLASMDLQKEAEQISLQFLPYTLLASFLISLLVAYIYARTIVAPILEIKRVTRRMMDLDAEVRLRVDSKDEIGDLKEQINSLYQHLLTVIADLHDKNEAILQLEKMKVEFLRGASHELKTPLASLKILIENMKENVGRYKDRDHYLGVALGIVDDLSHHVLQILSLSSVQEIREEKEEVDLLQMTQSLVKDYALLAKERELQVDISLTHQQAYINPSVMKLILSNLISNAIKHSTTGGLVRIGEREGELFIENSCSPEEQEQLAQSFSGNASRKAKGSGMGLFVVKSLLEHEKLPYRFVRQDDRLTFFIRFPRVSQD